jgi:hypothetical protein
MAEYRPYRVANRSAKARLAQMKLISVASFATAALFINWWVTEHTARLFRYAPALGPSLIGGLYAPWEWIVWWTRWHEVERLQPLWELCAREAALPLLVAAALAAGAINFARWWLRDSTPDLHGSARWANAQEVRASGFLAPPQYLPRTVRRWLVGAGLLKPLKPRDGIYVGAWGVPGETALSARLRAGPRAGVRANQIGQGPERNRADAADVAPLHAGPRPEGRAVAVDRGGAQAHGPALSEIRAGAVRTGPGAL